ncbi:hypothetical protein Ancab_004904 [Ancistrocladus abbreviatus]
MDGSVIPELSAWISRATSRNKYESQKLNTYESQVGTRGKCCPDIKVGLKIDRKFRELEMLIADGQRISKKSMTRGNIRQEINTIGSVVEGVKGAIWRDVSQGVVGTISIHGIVGVGKTAIVAAINNQALRATGLFDFVIWVDVSNGKNRFLLILDSMWQVYSPQILEFRSLPGDKI